MANENITIDQLIEISPIRKVGKYVDYDPEGIHKNVLFFAEDKEDIYLNGINYTKTSVNRVHIDFSALDWQQVDQPTTTLQNPSEIDENFAGDTSLSGTLYATLPEDINYSDIIVLDNFTDAYTDVNPIIVKFYYKYMVVEQDESTTNADIAPNPNDIIYLGDMKYEYALADKDLNAISNRRYIAIATYNKTTNTLYLNFSQSE